MAPPRRPPQPPAPRPFETRDALRCLGGYARARRVELGLGVEQLAGRMGVDARQVRRIERGDANLTFETLTGLASGLDRRPSDLLAAVERAFALADLEPTVLSDDASGEPMVPSSQRGSQTRDGAGAPLHRFIGNAVARLRRMAQLTQRELAEMAGVSLSAVQSVESGRHAPTTMTLETLARALRCEVSDLVGPALMLSEGRKTGSDA